MGDDRVDPGIGERALLQQPEVTERDDRIPVAPGSHVFLVQEVADAGLDAASVTDHRGRPGLATIG